MSLSPLLRKLLCLGLILSSLSGSLAAPTLTEPFEPGGYPASLAPEPVAPLQTHFSGDPLQIAPGFAALCDGSHLFIYRLEDTPRAVASLDLQSQCQDLVGAFAGLLLVQGDASFTLVDMGQPEAPRMISRVPVPEGLTQVYWRGEAIFALQTDGQTAVYDIENPVSPRFVRSLNLGTILGSWEGYLITGQGVQVCTFTIDAPSDPRLVTCQEVAQTYPAKQWGPYLYMVDVGAQSRQLDAIRVLDVSDPLNPQLIQELADRSYYGAARVAVTSNGLILSIGPDLYAYTRQPEGILQFAADTSWDVFPHATTGLGVVANQLWAVTQDAVAQFDLAAFPDFQNPAPLIEGSTYNRCTGCVDYQEPLGVIWNDIYAHFYQLLPGDVPTYLNRVARRCLVRAICGELAGVALDGDLAYILVEQTSIDLERHYGLLVWAPYAGPEEREVAEIRVPYTGGPAHLDVQDGFAYYLTGDSDYIPNPGLQRVDISNSSLPELDVRLPGPYLEFALETDYLYLLSETSIDVVDLQGSSGPQVIHHVGLPAALSDTVQLALTPQALVVGGWVFDRQDPAHPVYVADLPGRADCTQPQSIDRYVLCAGDPTIFDLIDAAAPRRLGQMAHSSPYMHADGSWLLTDAGLHRLPNLPASATQQALYPNLPASIPLNGLSGALGELLIPAGASSQILTIQASLSLAASPLVNGKRALSDVLTVQVEPSYRQLTRPLEIKLFLRLPAAAQDAGALALYRLVQTGWEPAVETCPPAGEGEIAEGFYLGEICGAGTYLVLAPVHSLHLSVVHVMSGR